MNLEFIYNWSFWAEIIATIAGILCVYLQAKENIIAWFFGIVSVSILAVIFYTNNLLSDFFLHIIFLILNIYGWWTWRRYQESDDIESKILFFDRRKWIIVGLVIILVTPVWGYLMLRLFDADFAFIDAFTTVGSLVAQYLLAKKYLENWIVWIVVDVVAVILYIVKGIYIVAILFFVYLILCVIGYSQWKRKRGRKNFSHPNFSSVD